MSADERVRPDAVSAQSQDAGLSRLRCERVVLVRPLHEPVARCVPVSCLSPGQLSPPPRVSDQGQLFEARFRPPRLGLEAGALAAGSSADGVCPLRAAS